MVCFSPGSSVTRTAVCVAIVAASDARIQRSRARIEILDLERVDRRIEHRADERLLEVGLILHRQPALRRVVVAVDIETDAHVRRERRVESRRRERELVADGRGRGHCRGVAHDPAARPLPPPVGSAAPTPRVNPRGPPPRWI